MAALPNATATDATRACEQPSLAHREAAKQDFRRGQRAFNAGDYHTAASHWNQAYQNDCTAHALLLNLALTHELLGRPSEALAALRAFNERAPDSPYVETNQARMERLKQSEAELRRKASASPPQPCPTPRCPTAALAAARPRDDRSPPTWPLGVAAAATVTAVAGGVLFFSGRSTTSDVRNRCGNDGLCPDASLVARGERARTRTEVGGWLFGAGLSVAAAGLAWHLWPLEIATTSGEDDDASRSDGWQARIAPGNASLHWSGHF